MQITSFRPATKKEVEDIIQAREDARKTVEGFAIQDKEDLKKQKEVMLQQKRNKGKLEPKPSGEDYDKTYDAALAKIPKFLQRPEIVSPEPPSEARKKNFKNFALNKFY